MSADLLIIGIYLGIPCALLMEALLVTLAHRLRLLGWR